MMACVWALVARGSHSTWAEAYHDGADDHDSDEYDDHDEPNAAVGGSARPYGTAVVAQWGSSTTYLACFYWAMTTITTVRGGGDCANLPPRQHRQEALRRS